MNRIFRSTSYAEDQPRAHLILHLHVLSRAVTLTTLLSQPVALASHLRSPGPSGLPQTLLRGAGVGSVSGLAVGLALTQGRMFGREDIEWRDRAWRLLVNPGQNRVDEGWVMGGLAGLGLGFARGARGLGLVGAGGLGTAVGIAGMMGFGGAKKEDVTMVGDGTELGKL